MSEWDFHKWMASDHPRRQNLINAVEKHRGRTLSEDEKKAFVIISEKGRPQVYATQAWLDKLQILSHRIVRNLASQAEYPLFWIYLFGVLFELYERENIHRDKYEMIPWVKQFLTTLDALRNCFTESERSFVRFMRHNHVHILVDYPWPKISKKGDKVVIKDAYDPEAIMNSKRIIESYHNDQSTAAIDFARRALPTIDELPASFLKTMGDP